METLVHQRKILVLILVKQTFLLSSHFNANNSHLFVNANNSHFFVNGKEIFKFKVDNKNFNFPEKFFLGSISNEFITTESREVS